MGGHRHSLRDALVSVVLPVRNGGAYLADAVTSILAQSHRNLELLLVDDHSDDGAVEDLDICDPRLRVLTSPRNGVAAAFNHGLARAEGEFVARMDADDLALPRRLEAQLGLFSSDHSIDICGTGVAFFPQSAVAGGNRHYQAWLNRLTSPQDLRLQIFIESPIPNP
ncbi:MAG: glycosyltransferase family 2 protein, partial [Xanthomonadales bacterium]|nr:glycosyltransferase family 2 protein [Xanthomonadales bacterium]